MVGIRGQLFMVILHFAEDLQLVWIAEISQWFVFCHLLHMCSIHTLPDLLVVPALWQDGYGATLGEQPPEDTVGAFSSTLS